MSRAPGRGHAYGSRTAITDSAAGGPRSRARTPPRSRRRPRSAGPRRRPLRRAGRGRAPAPSPPRSPATSPGPGGREGAREGFAGARRSPRARVQSREARPVERWWRPMAREVRNAGYHAAMVRYDASEIEPKWQRVWEDEGPYRASDDPDDARPRYYALDMFPYPSGDLHMGHAE